jgi:uncharacterized protein YecT (DUF1311 family)
MNTHPRRILGAFLPLACLLAALLPGPVRAQTDEEHAALRRESPEFNQAERELSDTWKALTQALPDAERKALVESQRTWIRTGRKQYAQEEARARGVSLVQGYVDSTRERTRMLKRYQAQILNEGSPVIVEGTVALVRDAGGAFWTLRKEDAALPYVLGSEQELAGMAADLRRCEQGRARVRVIGYLQALDAFAPSRGLTLEPLAGASAGAPGPAAPQAAAPAPPPVVIEAPSQPDFTPQKSPAMRVPEVPDPTGGPL